MDRAVQSGPPRGQAEAAGDEDVVFGVKRITPANLATRDFASGLFGLKSEQEWIQYFNEPQLAGDVAEPVQRLFEIARGTMIYGWYYYPLLTVGYAECTRVLECAARHAAEGAKVSPPVQQQLGSYKTILEALRRGGFIAEEHWPQWDVSREIRNSFAHPTERTILPLGDAVGKLRGTAEQINRLFAAVASSLA